MTNQTLDMCGYACPMPILKTKQALASMSSREVIEVICTDQGSKKDFVAFCNQLGHKLISQRDEGNKIIFQIEKN
ncbi:sulfurtransferase TusA family protein [Pseudothioglobus sp. nBUS_23]|jgi:tRNA 2-thiouridine synthesizing protein A|uniref:sulfurtransferase TusA family protein n=1 Tax=Pseudothioglobus sp. nBUS_23 TaxID=3395318 RepID=UPI003EB6F2EB|tara:strand:- start:854 stop:1078 length:225 start_codon:yes stop_codon:yes gene_type:complete